MFLLTFVWLFSFELYNLFFKLSTPMEKFLDKLLNYEVLSEIDVENICNQVIDILILEPNVRKVSPDAVIVGDIHGQFSDLVHIFENHGRPDKINYVFLGDFVDRGENSLECILFLLVNKILYPQGITLLRGNHEQKNINKVYGFYDEVNSKYGNYKVWTIINKVFSFLNISCIVDGRYLCVHGGISTRITINKLERVDRFEKLSQESIINDVIWSDPYYKNGSALNPRGSGFLFGEDVAKQFLMFNNLEMIVRSHQLAIEGYKWDFEGLCLTVWSAPNYMNKCSNPASVLLIEKNAPITSRNIKIFHKTLRDSSIEKNIQK